MEEILFENTYWVVTKSGMQNKEVEGPSFAVASKGEYYIDADRLDEDWIEHMTGKVWVLPAAFIEAYYAAFRMIRGQDLPRTVPALIPDSFSHFLAEPSDKKRSYTSDELINEGARRIQEGLTPRTVVFVNEQHALEYQCKELLDVFPALRGNSK